MKKSMNQSCRHTLCQPSTTRLQAGLRQCWFLHSKWCDSCLLPKSEIWYAVVLQAVLGQKKLTKTHSVQRCDFKNIVDGCILYLL